jgi:hypothetical protein
MQVQRTTETVITLVLTEAEAAWLHGNMQNPLGDVTLQEEDPYDNAMRRRFFEATQTN